MDAKPGELKNENKSEFLVHLLRHNRVQTKQQKCIWGVIDGTI